MISLRHGDYIMMEKINYMLDIDILRNSSQKNLDILRGEFLGFGCPNDTDILLPKQASKITRTGTGPLGTVKLTIYWSCTFLLILQIFLQYKKKKHCIKPTDNIFFYLFHLHLFQKHLGHSSEKNLLTRMSPDVYWPCRTN